MLSFSPTYLLKIDYDQQRHHTSFKCFLVYKGPLPPTESANSATTTLPAIVTITNGFGTILTGAATPVTNVPSLRTASLFNSTWHGHIVTLMHASGTILMVIPVLHAGDASIGLSGLDVELESDKRLFALFVFPGLPVFSPLNDGTLILLEDSVPRMRIANTQTNNTPWQTCARF